MASRTELSKAHVILLAIILCAKGDVSSLPELHIRYGLSLERVLRIILTFLPESTEPQRYTPVLQELVDGPQSDSGAEVDVASVKDLPEAVARKRVRKLRLRPLKHRDDDSDDSTDLLTQFLLHRAHLIDSETSLQPLILDLLLPFYHRSSALRTFLISNLLPLLRLNYEYYPNRDESLSLEMLESMDNHTAINVLLSMTGPQKDLMDLQRNLRGLLGPWMYGSKRSKRRRVSETARRKSISLLDESHSDHGWQSVNEWLLSRSFMDQEDVMNTLAEWAGPDDVDLGGYGEDPPGDSDLRTRYCQAGLAVVYASPNADRPVLDASVRVISQVARLLDLDEYSIRPNTTPPVRFDTEPIASTSRASLLQNALLSPSNTLTLPSAFSVSFLSAIICSLQTLDELGHPIPCRTATNICLHSSEDMQITDLRNVVTSVARHSRSDRDWPRIRQQLLWLRDWQSYESDSHPEYHGLFWRVSRETIETEILKALLEARGKSFHCRRSG